MSKIRKWLFDKALKQDAHQSFFDAGKRNKSIGVIGYDNGEDRYIKHINAFANKHRKAGNSVKQIVFKDIKSDENQGTYYFKNNIKWSGQPFGDLVDAFLETKFDMVYLLTSNYPNHIEFLLRTSKASFKTGFYVPDAIKYLDFAFESNHDDFSDNVDGLQNALDKLIYN